MKMCLVDEDLPRWTNLAMIDVVVMKLLFVVTEWRRGEEGRQVSKLQSGRY